MKIGALPQTPMFSGAVGLRSRKKDQARIAARCQSARRKSRPIPSIQYPRVEGTE